MAASKNAAPTDAKTAASKMHRRSRSGCFTCRLRRKKCEEGKPSCKACHHLGLRCDYKRPMWWSNGEQRRNQKELIKNIIKRTQLSKKSTQGPQTQQPSQQHPQKATLNISSPPGLTHSAPTSAEAPFADQFPPSTRCNSEGSPFSTGCDFPYGSSDGYFHMPPPPQPFPGHPQFPMFSPYEVDIKTERQIFVNDVPTRRDSTISTFSTFQPPPGANGETGYPPDSWVTQEHFESTSEEFPEEPVDFNFFEYPHGPLTPDHEAVINVDDNDQYLLSHFFDKVLKLIFPILDANQHGSARADVILPALQSNRAYLHCCLSIAAIHMGATEGITGEQIESEILRHRYSAVSELCAALGNDTNHAQVLEATLGMIFFKCVVGAPKDQLHDISWWQHFDAASELVDRLGLQTAALASPEHPSFNMTLISWIDILGSSILGQLPKFADTYRNLNMNKGSMGLSKLMGCDDKIMFLISEIVCLDAQKCSGLSEIDVCRYVELLAAEIGGTEATAHPVENCISSTGAIRSKQLTVNITAVFRVAARIYLCTLVPGYLPSQPSMCHLTTQFSELMNYIPAGPEGFDRSLVWPLLIAGSASVEASPFRSMFEERCTRLGDAANFGSFGRINELLRQIWHINDTAAAQGDHQGVPWRNVMRSHDWDHLLI